MSFCSGSGGELRPAFCLGTARKQRIVGKMGRSEVMACMLRVGVLLVTLGIAFVDGAENLLESNGPMLEIQHHDSVQSLVGVENEQKEFDYFVFSQQWPGTYCTKSGTCCEKVAQPVTFTVHGVWPEYNDGSYPSCCTGPGFDEEKIGELTDLLQEFWPTLSCTSPQQCSGKKYGTFWQHEWEKHGTCSYPTIPDEATYFVIGLNLRLQYDITKVFNDAGFTPSSTEFYQTSALVAAIEDAWGAKPIFTCSSKLINEIWLCFTKELKIRDCGVSSNSCSASIQIPTLKFTSENHLSSPLSSA